MSVAGGRYQICWCASGFPCSEAEDFAVTAGTLHVVGPAGTPGHTAYTRTCVSGQTCAFKGITGYDEVLTTTLAPEFNRYSYDLGD